MAIVITRRREKELAQKQFLFEELFERVELLQVFRVMVVVVVVVAVEICEVSHNRLVVR
jgi:hypothetical protein